MDRAAASAAARARWSAARAADVSRAGRARGAVVHGTTTASSCTRRELAAGRVYAVPIARCCWRGCTSSRSPGARGGRPVGAVVARSSSSPPACCSRCPTRNDETRTVHGPGGSIAAPAADAAAFQGAVDADRGQHAARRADPGRAVPDEPLRARRADRPAVADLAAARRVPDRGGRAGRDRAARARRRPVRRSPTGAPLVEYGPHGVRRLLRARARRLDPHATSHTCKHCAALAPSRSSSTSGSRR